MITSRHRPVKSLRKHDLSLWTEKTNNKNNVITSLNLLMNMNQAQDGDFCISEKNNAEWGKCCQKEQNKNIYNILNYYIFI